MLCHAVDEHHEGSVCILLGRASNEGRGPPSSRYIPFGDGPAGRSTTTQPAFSRIRRGSRWPTITKSPFPS
jgi:hypothetical protein